MKDVPHARRRDPTAIPLRRLHLPFSKYGTNRLPASEVIVQNRGATPSPFARVSTPPVGNDRTYQHPATAVIVPSTTSTLPTLSATSLETATEVPDQRHHPLMSREWYHRAVLCRFDADLCFSTRSLGNKDGTYLLPHERRACPPSRHGQRVVCRGPGPAIMGQVIVPRATDSGGYDDD
ncbi:hypothetical protein GLOTRDRAFT_129150 [Gloeophyllum trabeum ATCC 11539]|uniref:Uncharacterized protein n=1 Tax=Gloeophyllum trabeum (strain ATCC 11539 / FP-39264 / Madison 617) TaxID=670483 RepID=S7RSE6_GLOTA|nr:uncharacterized protein GLOTRDRAFT_129150 [Gloeophyllum trabeum ATCC 11539]EPQ55949.1 hypothetical protein GLOTRDRAFT_129150 [Gloeophyllum trabeum ATCC 11539]